MKLKELLGQSWWERLKPFVESPEFTVIEKFVFSEYQKFKCFPPADQVFTAFNLCHYDSIRVVILGQDPYIHPNQAAGIAFGIPENQHVVPPSLENIRMEVEKDVYNGMLLHFDYTLRSWLSQGVFCQNVALTVRSGKSGSHMSIWQPFTVEWIKLLNQTPGKVWLLWGNDAKAFKSYINPKNHYILEAAHPAAESYRKNAGFFGCGHFSKVNQIIEGNNGESIRW
ncbi:uracil-DNA glycosylase [Patescibacteria group bacterium]|uniref:Putative uracil DNA glycosylase superfamily protein n=1 Tax=viral metagenome TaxID=1070528 RepID=A0A6M3M0E1_9ZZZZ|nr:uracil-DNA glycosylase [Patescibacteria group bacterium]